MVLNFIKKNSFASIYFYHLNNHNSKMHENLMNGFYAKLFCASHKLRLKYFRGDKDSHKNAKHYSTPLHLETTATTTTATMHKVKAAAASRKHAKRNTKKLTECKK